ncbi:MAG: tyrosine-type recombinase/integrase [Planctomycetota bacterium]
MSPTSTTRRKPRKPKGSPLTPHANGQWCKKHLGHRYYFGIWEHHDAALKQFNHDWPYITEGKTPPPMEAANGVDLALLANTWLDERRKDVSDGQLSTRTWDEYKRVAGFVLQKFGRTRPPLSLGKKDFAELRREANQVWRAGRITNFVNYTKQMFRYGVDLELIDHLPNFGRRFKGQSAPDRRRQKYEAGQNLFTPEECQVLVDNAGIVMQAMIMLGLNAGFGNKECADLTENDLDLNTGIADTLRSKSQVWRRAALWPETVAAIRAARAIRPKPSDPADANLIFITKRGNRYVNPDTSDNAVAMEFGKLMRKTGVKKPNDPRKRLGFYSLRRTFRTHADEVLDNAIVDVIMGHANESMGDTYVQSRDDARLWRVADHVRAKLGIATHIAGSVGDDGDASSAA